MTSLGWCRLPSPLEQDSDNTTFLPSSPYDDDRPVIATDARGMIVEDEESSRTTSSQASVVRYRRTPRKRRQRMTYVSRHFTDEALEAASSASSPAAKLANSLTTPPQTPAPSRPKPRIYYGLNVDDLSSDSSLSEPPSDLDLETEPFALIPKSKGKAKARKHQATKSPYFPSTPHRHRQHFLSTLPFPPLSHPTFGLMQEKLAHYPFRLLIATIFLNKTPGDRAMPVFYQLMERYPTPAELAEAEVSDVTSIIQKLGFQNQRARKCVGMAKVWCERLPIKGARWRKVDYPRKGDGRGVKEGEVLEDGDDRVGWEIAHLPGVGAYAHDSWRMFCRDVLLGRAQGWDGEGAEVGFEPEWKRVLPLDKELRAWMTWMWLKEGWLWNKETGERTKADEELMRLARGGGIVVEEREKASLTVQAIHQEAVQEVKVRGKVGKPAGEVLGDIVQEKDDLTLSVKSEAGGDITTG